jgi:hypothetical protein
LIKIVSIPKDASVIQAPRGELAVSYFRLASCPQGLNRVFSFGQIRERTRPKIMTSPTYPVSGFGD